MNVQSVFVINVLATWYMVGLIWMVQVVHYKLFDRVGTSEFGVYEADHNRLITPIVALPMLVELGTACVLIVFSPSGFPAWARWLGVTLVIAIWLSTSLLQIPCHARLSAGFDAVVHARLVGTNWIRTILWTARGVLMGYFVVRLIE
jgi:uncharacterized membrane protein